MATLMDELVEEILLRLPPDEPASLVRAAVVCKPWCRLISTPGFRRRFREFHRAAPPMLGFLLDLWDYVKEEYTARFVPTSSSSSLPPLAGDRRGFALDARHGRVLLYTSRGPHEDAAPFVFQYDFVVWNPITDEHRELPALNWYLQSPAWKAAVLCLCAGAGAGGGGDDSGHLAACHVDAPFLVVFVGVVMEHVVVYVYSSETGAWSGEATTNGHLGPLDNCIVPMGPSLLADGGLHFAVEDGRRILTYDLASSSLSVINTPWNDETTENMGLVTAVRGGGGLGVASVEGYNLYLWSLLLPPDGLPEWQLDRVIELDMMLSLAIGVPWTSFTVVGFAEGAGTVFLSGSDGIYTVALESGSSQVNKVHKLVHFFGVVPYVSFYTPDLARSILPAAAHQ